MKLRLAFLLGVIVALLAVLSTAFRGCAIPYEGEVVYRACYRVFSWWISGDRMIIALRWFFATFVLLMAYFRYREILQWSTWKKALLFSGAVALFEMLATATSSCNATVQGEPVTIACYRVLTGYGAMLVNALWGLGISFVVSIIYFHSHPIIKGGIAGLVCAFILLILPRSGAPGTMGAELIVFPLFLVIGMVVAAVSLQIKRRRIH